MRLGARVLWAIGGALVLASCLVSIDDAEDPASPNADAASDAGAAGAGGVGGSGGWGVGGASGGGSGGGGAGGTSGGAAGSSASGGTGSGGNAGNAGSAGGPTTGLIGHWPFDEGTGEVAGDATPLQRDGKLPGTGVTWTTTGLFGNALQFINPDEGIDIAGWSGSAFPQAGSFTVWVKGEFSASEMNSRGILDNWDSARHHLYVRRVNNVAAISLQCAFQPAADPYAYVDVVPIETKVWQLVSIGWDIPAQAGYCYVHGTKLSGTTSKSFTPTDQLFMIGESFVGVLDDVRLYDHMLSDSELAALLALPGQ